jgi:hypothetical protein
MMNSKLLTESEVAQRLSVTIFALRKWRARRIGPIFIKLTQSPASPVRYDEDDLEKYIEDRKRHGQQGAR